MFHWILAPSIGGMSKAYSEHYPLLPFLFHSLNRVVRNIMLPSNKSHLCSPHVKHTDNIFQKYVTQNVDFYPRRRAATIHNAGNANLVSIHIESFEENQVQRVNTKLCP